MEGIYPRIDRIFTSLLSLGRVERAGEVERSFQDGRREVHKSRLEALQNVCHSWRIRGEEERERERRATTLSARVSRVLMYVRVLVGAKPLSRNDHVSLQPFPLDLPL